MSGEQLSTENTIKTQEVGSDGKVIHSKTNGRVDINTLMNKVRQQEKKTKKRKFSFFWSNIFCSSNYWHYCIFVNF